MKDKDKDYFKDLELGIVPIESEMPVPLPEPNFDVYKKQEELKRLEKELAELIRQRLPELG